MSSRVNPYSPPKTPPETLREKCPVCGYHVGFLRFLFPFGGCANCGNYLAVRNWSRKSWLRELSFWAIVSSIFGARMLGVAPADLSMFSLVFGYFVIFAVYDRVGGKLVPAVCWGLFAVPDDPRLLSSPGSLQGFTEPVEERELGPPDR